MTSAQHVVKFIVLLITILSSVQLIDALSSGARPLDRQHLPCDSVRIAILDVATLPELQNREKCDLHSDVHVNPMNGVVYPPGHPFRNVPRLASIIMSVNAGPWFLKEAIQSGQYYTEDINKADVVFVYDFCYYIKWLAYTHYSHDKKIPTPDSHSENLNAAYEAILQHPRWLKHNGSDFVFFESHPGFMNGGATYKIRHKLCNSFISSTMIILDRPMRNFCGSFLQMHNIIIAPYVPAFISEHALDQVVLPTIHPVGSRTQIVYYKGRCIPPRPVFVGMKLRAYLASRLSSGVSSASITCTDISTGPQKATHSSIATMVEEMQRSVFCLALPGDNASSRRLSEMLGAGCIPVFLGPPYHSTPIPYAVDWPSLAVFLNVSDYHAWMDEEFSWSISPTERAINGQDARWWLTDAHVSPAMVHLKTVDEVIPYLSSIPEAELEKKVLAITEHRSKFTFATSFTSPPNAVDALVTGMCMAQKHQLQQTIVM